MALPASADWVDHGPVLTAGASGEWDHLLYGGFAGTVVKKGGTFFLYYQGARDFSDRFGTATDRAIGVATSNDGVKFEKFAGNPVLSWQPNAGHEEGAVSGAALLNPDGDVLLYYGANTAVDDWNVRADGRLAVSSDGLEFDDAGIFLDHDDDALWGSGDELFPIIGFHDDRTFYVYYLPNGRGRTGSMGVAWGATADERRSSSRVHSRDPGFEVWGMGGSARIAPRRYALFLNDVRRNCLEVRTVDLDDPARVSAPVRAYEFANMSQGTVFRDDSTGTWYLYYRSGDAASYGVRTHREPVDRTRSPREDRS